MAKATFIHCADLHLDSPFLGLEHLPQSIYERIKQSTFDSFRNIIDAALREDVDFILIAGDIYDGEDRSIRAQLFFREQMNRLKERGIPAFIIHGNHDHLGGNWTKVEMPDNVFIFPGHAEVIAHKTRSGAKIHLYGYSYPKRHVEEKIIDLYRKQEGADFHIGILHGSDFRDRTHYAYAPFRVRDLLDKGFDYWALGHIHKRTVLSENPPILYPGNPQGRNRMETGEKGCYLVRLTSEGADLQFIETAPIVWEAVRPEERLETFEQLFSYLSGLKEDLRSAKKNWILDVRLPERNIGEGALGAVENGELLDWLQEEEKKEPFFVWIRSLEIEPEPLTVVEHADFLMELERIFSSMDDLREPLAPLFFHRDGKRFLDPLTDKEREELLDRARQGLLSLIQSGRPGRFFA